MRWLTRRRLLAAVAIGLVVAIGLTVAAWGADNGPSSADQPSPTTPSTRDGQAPTPPDTAPDESVALDHHDDAPTPWRSSTSNPAPTRPTRPTVRPTRPVSPSSTTIDPATLLATLSQGDSGHEVMMIQRMLNVVTGTELDTDGIYGPETTRAVRNFQLVLGLPATGDADHETRMTLTFVDRGRSAALPEWPVPTIGSGGRDGCQVVVVGDSLMASSAALHEAALASINCAAAVDGVGGRSLTYGWQCRSYRSDGTVPLVLRSEPEAGNASCAPSGLELLRRWRDGQALGDIVVVALGTNDAGLVDEAAWIERWVDALRLTDGRPVLFVTTSGRPGNEWHALESRYTEALRRWCGTRARCHLADWALTESANDPASYVDHVHLTTAATESRAHFIADAVLALFEGRPLPNPSAVPPATTTTRTTTTTTTTTPTTTTTTTTTTTLAPTTTTTSTTTTTTADTPTSTTTGDPESATTTPTPNYPTPA